MNVVRITIDDDLSAQVLSASGVVELYDSTGRLIGVVTPAPPKGGGHWEKFLELTEEEIDRRCTSPEPGLTTQEVIESLKTRS
jgi:hypothetical protein